MSPESPLTPEQEARIKEIVREATGSVERLDMIIALLARMPMQLSRSPNGLTRNLVGDLFPDYKWPNTD